VVVAKFYPRTFRIFLNQVMLDLNSSSEFVIRGAFTIDSSTLTLTENLKEHPIEINAVCIQNCSNALITTYVVKFRFSFLCLQI
jgi:hypothetical protein